MKKKVFGLLLAFMVCLSMIPAVTVSALTDGDYEYELLNNEVTIIRYLGAGGDIVVPSSIQGKPVTKIGAYGVFGSSVLYPENGLSKEVREAIRSVTIPSTVTDMSGSGIFADCVNLTSVTIPNSVTKLGDKAFEGCTSLQYVELPDSITEIGIAVFRECTSLTKISWPKLITKIPDVSYSGAGMWQQCTSLTDVALPDGIEVVGGDAFNSCTSLTSVTLPNSIKTIAGGAFSGCTSLAKVNLNLGLEEIGNSSFAGCESLKSIIIPTTVKSIGYQAFGDCPIEEILIPYGVETINNNTFRSGNNKNIVIQAVYLPSTILEKSMWGMYESNYPNMISYAPEGSFVAKNCARWNCSYIIDNSCDSPIHVVYNGKRISFDQIPVIENGRTLVPLRAIFEAMGAMVDWNGDTQTVTAKRNGITVSLTVGNNTMYVDGRAVTLDVAAKVINGRTMVPARAVAEGFDANVEWNGIGGIVFINE